MRRLPSTLRPGTVACAVLVTLTLTGCASSAGPTPPAPTPTPAPAAPTSPSPSVSVPGVDDVDLPMSGAYLADGVRAPAGTALGAPLGTVGAGGRGGWYATLLLDDDADLASARADLSRQLEGAGFTVRAHTVARVTGYRSVAEGDGDRWDASPSSGQAGPGGGVGIEITFAAADGPVPAHIQIVATYR